jgi:serine/threonine-protein kinase
LDVSDGRQTDIWVYQWERDTLARLTFGPGNSEKPVWTPDGRRLVFSSSQNGPSNLFWQQADGTGPVQRLTMSALSQAAWSWHPNGHVLAFHEFTQGRQDDVLMLPVEGDEASGWKPGTPVPFLTSPFFERAPMFSADGRWVAYQSNESGQDEIYVTGYPGPRGKWLISTNGGVTPVWSRTRQELLFVEGSQLMVAPYTVEGDSFRAGNPRLWADAELVLRRRTGPTRSFDLHPDGDRVFLAKAGGTEGPSNSLVLVSNLFDELRRIAPPKR